MKTCILWLFIVGLTCYSAQAESETHEDDATTENPIIKVECPEGEDLVMLPDSDDQTLYYECRGGSATQHRCPPNMTFDADGKFCRSILAPMGDCPIMDGEFPTFLQDANNKSMYYECRAGQPIPMQCPHKLEFNPTLNVCDWPTPTAPLAKPAGACPEIDGPTPTILGDEFDCSTYYVCYAGKPFQAMCPLGLLFNAERGYCDFPYNVPCPSASA